MNVFNISKFSFYVLLLSVAFAQILAVSAEENVDDVDGVTCEWVLAMMWSSIDKLLASEYF